MTPVLPARRRAEEFNSLIEHSMGNDFIDARYAEFLEIVSALRTTPPVQAHPAFVTGLRERLMVASRTALVPSEESRLTLPARHPRPRDRRIATAVGGFAVVGATASMAMAAQTALPGDVLYPLKRAIENVETGISVDESQKGATMLANASGRLDEITALSREGSLEHSTAIAETLNTFTEQATVASDLLLSDYASTGDESSISELLDFTSISMETLAALEELIPADAQDELLRAARVLTQIGAEAKQACPACGGPAITKIPEILASASTFAGGGMTGDLASQATQAGDGIRKHHGTKVGATRDEGDEEGSALSPGTVLSTGDTDAGTTDSDGPTQQPSDGPIRDLNVALVDGGDTPPPSPPGLPGLSGVNDPAEGLDGAIDGLSQP